MHVVGIRSAEGQRVLDFLKVSNLAVTNTYYQHRESHKWTWYRYNLHGTKKLLYSLAKNYRGKSSEGTYTIKDEGNNLLTQR